MGINRVRPDDLYGGVPYAYASSIPSGSLVFTAGACPLDQNGTVVAPDDLERQTEQAMANLFSTLAAAGSSPAAVLRTTVYVVAAERSDLVRAWNMVKACFGDIDPPSTLLGVSFLGYPGQLVEIEAIAVAGNEG